MKFANKLRTLSTFQQYLPSLKRELEQAAIDGKNHLLINRKTISYNDSFQKVLEEWLVNEGLGYKYESVVNGNNVYEQYLRIMW